MKKKLVTALTIIALSIATVGCSSTKETTENTVVTTSIEYPVEEDNEDIGEVSTYIELGDNININGEGVTVENNIVTITKAGTYSIKGTLADGQIVVNASSEENVNLLLDGANISCSNSAAINIKSCKNAIIALADGSENTMTDASSYVFDDATTDGPSAAIFSKDDLTIIGEGSLQVNANYNNGIQSKDDLKIKGGNITVTSVDDGLKGKDSVTVTKGTININAKGDGIQSNNDTDTSKGYVYITGGTLNITSDQDGIQAESNLIVTGGDITVQTGGGSANAVSKAGNDSFGGFGMKGNGEMPEMPTDGEAPTAPTDGTAPQAPADGEAPIAPTDGIAPQTPTPQTPTNETTTESTTDTTTETVSAKALKATSNIIIDEGNINIDSSDDSIHSNSALVINGGTINIKSGDDGLHSDATLDINGGTIDITKSYEAIESEVITINDGNIHVVSSDDGLNAAGGNDSSSINGRPGENSFSSSSTGQININGGYLVVDCTGDGIDSNGSVSMTDGTVIVNGPTNGGNGALDYDSEFNMTGGTLIAAGSVGMVQTPSESSSQKILNVTLTSKEANTLIHIEDADGNEVLTFAPTKSYSSVVVCTPEIKEGTTYNVYSGGSSTGTASDGLYSGGTYSDGSQVGSSSVSSSITNITESGASASSGMGGHQGGGGKGGMTGGKGTMGSNQ